MHRLLRRILAATLASLPIAAPVAAQDAATNGTVGAPELRGFRLPGTRVVPAETAPDPAAETPAQPAEREPASETPAPAARMIDPAPAQRQAPRSAAPAASAPVVRESAPAAAPLEAPAAPLDAAPAAEGYPAQDYSGSPAPVDLLPPAPAADGQGFGNIWPALAAGLALLAGLVLLQRRRSAALAGSALERSALAEIPEAPTPEPVPVRRPVVVKEEEDEALQPAIELQFEPERMVAGDKQATVNFKLVVMNKGEGAARNILIEAKMFSASQSQAREIAAFLAAPSEIKAPALTLGPGRGIDASGAVMLDRQDAREIVIEGRPLFIPTVVIRIAYQWGRGRSSQVHGTYLVGIENPKSPDKMGPFRLDMGPRIYRSVGGRKIELARSAAR